MRFRFGFAAASFLLMSMCLAPAEAWAASTFDVSSGDDWSAKIAGASAGDTLLVHEGAPAPNGVTVDKALTIANAPNEAPVLDGGNVNYGFLFDPAAAGSTVSGLRFKNYTWYAVASTSGLPNVNLSNDIFDACGWTLGTKVTASSCTIKNAANGGYAIDGSSFTNCSYLNISGDAVAWANNLTFTGCSFNGVGYVAVGGGGHTLTDCIVTQSSNILAGCANVTITRLTATGVAGFGYCGGSNATVTDSTFTSVGVGIYAVDGLHLTNVTHDTGNELVAYCSNVTLDHVTGRNLGYLAGGDGFTATNVLVENGSTAFNVSNFTGSAITLNNLSGFGFCGGSNVTVSDSTFTNVSTGSYAVDGLHLTNVTHDTGNDLVAYSSNVVLDHVTGRNLGYLAGGDGFTATNVLVENSSTGFNVSNFTGSAITLNNLTGFGFCGGSNISVSDSTFTNVSTGCYAATNASFNNLTFTGGSSLYAYATQCSASNSTLSGLFYVVAGGSEITLTNVTASNLVYGLSGCDGPVLTNVRLDGGQMAFCSCTGISATRLVIVNFTTGPGEGFYASSGNIVSSTIYGNSSVVAWLSDPIAFDSCIITGNGNFVQGTGADQASAEYSLLQTDGTQIVQGTGNLIGMSPLFVNAANGNFHLQQGSPAIDTGDPALTVPAGGGARIDMGAFEYIVAVTDTTPPVVTIVTPVDGATTNNPFYTFSGTFQDPNPGSGVNPATAVILLDNVNVTAQATVTASGFIFTPTQHLSEGSHVLKVSVSDNAGNPSAQALASLFVDTIEPSITNLSPSCSMPSNNTQPAFSGAFSDQNPSSGIDPNSAHLFLDGADVTVLASVSPSGFSFTPTQALGEGTHILEVEVADHAGNVSFPATITVVVDTSAPNAPVVVTTEAEQTVVTYTGTLEQNATILASADNATISAASASGTQFVVVVAKANADNFALSLRAQDPAGNISAATVVNGAFAPVPPVLAQSGFQALNPKLMETVSGKRTYYFDQATCTVQAIITGGVDPKTVTFNGQQASGAGSVFTLSMTFPEGATDVVLNANDSMGAYVTDTITVVVDTTAPKIVLADPVTPTTAPVGFLYLNGRNATDAAALRSDATLPRNVYSQGAFALTGTVGEPNLADAAPLAIEVRETSAISGDLTWPFVDYAQAKASSLSSILQQTPVKTISGTTLTVVAGQPITYSVQQVAQGLAESLRSNADHVYLVTLRTTDKVGHEGLTHLWVKVDTTAPKLVTAISDAGNVATIDGNGNVTLKPGPCVAVGADNETVRVYTGSSPSAQTLLRKANPDGAWVFQTPVGISLTTGTTINLNVEDLAGNVAQRSFTAFHSGGSNGGFDEQAFYEDDSGNPNFFINRSTKLAHQMRVIIPAPTNEIKGSDIVGDNFFQQSGADGRIPPWYQGLVGAGTSGISPPFASTLGPGGQLNAALIAGNSFAELPPSWSQPRVYSFALQGTFPQYSGFQIPAVSNAANQNPAPAGTITESTTYNFGCALGSTQGTVLVGSIAGSGNVGASPSGTITLPSTGTRPRPGLQTVRAEYIAIWDKEAYQELVNTPTQIHTRTWSYANSVDVDLFKYRSFTLFQVAPDTIPGAQRTTLLIRGYFGDSIKPGDTVSVSFAASAGASGSIQIAPATPGGALSATGLGTVIEEDIFNRTVLQTLQVAVIPTGDAAGAFDVTVNGSMLPQTVRVVKAQLLADANHDGQINGTDAAVKRTPHGAILTGGFGLANHPALGDRVQVKLDIDLTDPLLQFATFKLLNNNKRIKIFTAATNGTELADDASRTWARPSQTPPTSVYLEFPADAEPMLTLQISGGLYDSQNSQYLTTYTATDTLKVDRLTSGMGSADGIAPTTTVVPGYASLNLTRGNLFCSALVRSYQTAALGPNVSLAYNHLDGLETGLGLSWRTNYDMRLFDASVDKDGDGQVAMAERADGDLLCLVAADGRRFLFKYAGSKFISDSKGGLLLASVDPDPTDFPTQKQANGAQYQLILNDNFYYFFNAQGQLVRIEDLRGQHLDIDRDANGFAVTVRDGYGRNEDLRRVSVEPNGGASKFIAGLSGRQVTALSFEYDATDSETDYRRMNKVTVSGNFSHGGSVAYGLTYNAGSKVSLITLPSVVEGNPGVAQSYSRPIAYTPANSPLNSTQAVITEPAGGTSAYAGIVPDQDAWATFTDPAGVTATRVIDTNTRKVSSMANGRYHNSMQYDAKGNLTQSQVSGGVTMTYTYGDASIPSANLLLTSTLVGAGGSTTYEYETAGIKTGLLKAVTDPVGNKTQYAYDAQGFLQTTTDAASHTWTVAQLNAFGQPLQTSSPEGRTTSAEYTFTGLNSTSTDMFGFKSSFGYDNLNRMVLSVAPSKGKVLNTYDPLGRVLTSTDELGRVTTNTLDAWGRTVRVSHPGINDTTITYTRNTGSGYQIVEALENVRTLSTRNIDAAGRTVDSSVPLVVQNNPVQVAQATTEYHYTAEGWLDYTVDPMGGVTQNTYDNAGRVVKVASPNGAEQSTAYNAAGWVSSSTDPDHNTSYMEYDANGRVTKTTNPAGGYVTTVYKSTGQVLSVTPSLGNGTTYEYDQDGVQSKVTDPLGNATLTNINTASKQVTSNLVSHPNIFSTTQLDNRGFVGQTVNAVATTNYVHDLAGRMNSSQTSARGPVSYSFDNLDRTTGTFAPFSSSGVTYDAASGDLKDSTSPLGLKTSYQIDGATGDTLSSADDVAAPNTATPISTVVQRDLNGNVKEYLDAKNRSWKQTYNVDNYRASMTSPDGVVTSYDLRKGGLPNSVSVAGQTTSFKYNELNQPVSVKDPTGRETISQYDTLGTLIKRTSGGRSQIYNYDPQTRLVNDVVLPGGRFIHYTYDDLGHVTSMTDPKGFTTGYEYDNLGRRIKTTYPDGKFETFTYQAVGGDPDVYTDRAGRQTKFDYDLGGRLVKKTFLDTGDVVTLNYNAAGQVTGECFNGSTVAHDYDKRGRLTSVSQDGQTCAYTYNEDDQIKTKSYGVETLTYAYQGDGHLQSVTGSTGTVAYTYDAKGRVHSETLPNNLTRTVAYDNANRMTGMTQNLNGTVENFSYGYTSDGKLAAMNGPGWSVSFAYDGGGRMTNELRTGTGAYSHSYQYDPNDNRTQQVSQSDPALTSRLLDFESGLPVEVVPVTGAWTVSGGKLLADGTGGTVAADGAALTALNLGINVSAPITLKVQPDVANLPIGSGEVLAGLDFGRDANGRYIAGLAVSKLDDGQGGYTLQRVVRIVYIPAATGIPALVSQTSPQAYTGEELTLSVQVSLDTALAEIVEDQGSQQALYGPANITSGSYGLEARTLSLTGPGTEGHAQFDDIQWQLLSGTSETRNYVYNNLNQLTSITGAETTTYSYNDAGLMTQQIKNGVASDHAYDRLNRLKSVNVGGANGSYSEYSYFGSSWMRRSASVDGALTHYMYDGFACVGQTTAGTTTLYGVPGQTPLWEKTGNSATLVYPQDGRGNITGLWNGTQYVQKYNYDAFGNVKTTDATGHAIQNTSGPRFQGQLYDAATDQVYLRNRYYSPGTGRFNAIDPIGYSGGHNLYGYCGGDPVNGMDWMGQDPHWNKEDEDVFVWDPDNDKNAKPNEEGPVPGQAWYERPSTDGKLYGFTSMKAMRKWEAAAVEKKRLDDLKAQQAILEFDRWVNARLAEANKPVQVKTANGQTKYISRAEFNKQQAEQDRALHQDPHKRVSEIAGGSLEHFNTFMEFEKGALIDTLFAEAGGIVLEEGIALFRAESKVAEAAAEEGATTRRIEKVEEAQEGASATKGGGELSKSLYTAEHCWVIPNKQVLENVDNVCKSLFKEFEAAKGTFQGHRAITMGGKPIIGAYDRVNKVIHLTKDGDEVTLLEELLHWKLTQYAEKKGLDLNTIRGYGGEDHVHKVMENLGLINGGPGKGWSLH